MERSTAPDEPELEHLIEVCLELFEESGPGAVDAVLRDHPDRAAEIRERFDLLGRMGLVGEPPAESRPEEIGGFAILGVLGRGGMGVVYEAQQEQPRRRVALKVLRTLPRGDGLRRFQHEAELLGRLQHPGIAQVYEVGTAPVGGMTVPFFAMELVRGRPIDEYARAECLGVRGRLELVARVADAVHHAHVKGVVHRDLKPANVLVDERGEPRILDFGIARTVDPDMRLESLRTEVGQIIGTLATMSPEQAAGDPDEVDSRTDVYSLGVVAYELLTGRLPHETGGLSMLQALRAIQEEEPPRPSQFDGALRGDVETILRKALEKEKERRYSSAHELALDLRRFLRHEPIGARPTTALYQVARFSRRHRGLVAGAGAFVVALALGLAGTLYGLFDAARERDEAERRFRLANASLELQKRMFAAADPRREGVRVDDLLDQGVLLLSEVADPVERAAFARILGEAFESIGRFEKAEALLVDAVETLDEELGPADLQALDARASLASLYTSRLSDFARAEEALGELETVAAEAHGAEHEVALRARMTRADLEFERGAYAESAEIARDVLRLAEDGAAPWWRAKHALAKALERLSDFDGALAVARELHDRSLATFGEAHPASWSAMTTYGNMLRDAGRLHDGIEVLERLVELRTAHLGAEHPNTINAKANFAISCTELNQLDRAEALLREVLDACERIYPGNHPERLFALNTLGSVHMLQGRVADAEPILREAAELAPEVFGEEHLNTSATRANLAKALAFLQRYEEAEELFVAVLDFRIDAFGREHEETLTAMCMFGDFLTRSSRAEEADPLLEEALAIAREEYGTENHNLGTLLLRRGENLLAQGRLEEAEEILLEMFEFGERLRPGHLDNRAALRALVQVYLRSGRSEEAARLQEQLRAG